MDKQWKVVPVEPTEEMKAAAFKYANGDAVYKNVGAEVLRIEEGIYGEIYDAMIAAAPQAPSASDEFRKVLDRALVDAYGAGVRGADFDMLTAKRRVSAALTSSPGVDAAEPAAWEIPHLLGPELTAHKARADEAARLGFQVHPLFRHAPPSPAPIAGQPATTNATEVRNG